MMVNFEVDPLPAKLAAELHAAPDSFDNTMEAAKSNKRRLHATTRNAKATSMADRTGATQISEGGMRYVIVSSKEVKEMAGQKATGLRDRKHRGASDDLMKLTRKPLYSLRGVGVGGGKTCKLLNDS
ncbi:hypothetical protein HN51_033786 [Arachis hypogaea]